MNADRQKVFDFLDEMGILYEVAEHPAVYTIEDMDQLHVEGGHEIAKNLFLRDDKKKRYFLIVLQKDKKADLKNLRERLGCRPLGFASEEDLQAYLGLRKGSVTPLGVLNDSTQRVEVVLDREMLSYDRIGIHPNDNTATVWLRPQDLAAVVEKHGNSILYLDL